MLQQEKAGWGMCLEDVCLSFDMSKTPEFQKSGFGPVLERVHISSLEHLAGGEWGLGEISWPVCG